MYILDTEKGSLLRGVSVCRAVCTYWTQRKAHCCVVCLCVHMFVIVCTGCVYTWDTEKGSLLRGVSVCRGVCTYGTQRKARCCVVYLCVRLCVHIGHRERLIAAWCVCV